MDADGKLPVSKWMLTDFSGACWDVPKCGSRQCGPSAADEEAIDS